MPNETDIERFAEKLQSLGLPCYKLQVFGRTRINVHVTCKSRSAVDRWAQVLAVIEPGQPISCTRTRIPRAKFKGDAANQHSVPGWIVTL